MAFLITCGLKEDVAKQKLNDLIKRLEKRLATYNSLGGYYSLAPSPLIVSLEKLNEWYRRLRDNELAREAFRSSSGYDSPGSAPKDNLLRALEKIFMKAFPDYFRIQLPSDNELSDFLGAKILSLIIGPENFQTDTDITIHIPDEEKLNVEKRLFKIGIEPFWNYRNENKNTTAFEIPWFLVPSLKNAMELAKRFRQVAANEISVLSVKVPCEEKEEPYFENVSAECMPDDPSQPASAQASSLTGTSVLSKKFDIHTDAQKISNIQKKYGKEERLEKILDTFYSLGHLTRFQGNLKISDCFALLGETLIEANDAPYETFETIAEELKSLGLQAKPHKARYKDMNWVSILLTVDQLENWLNKQTSAVLEASEFMIVEPQQTLESKNDLDASPAAAQQVGSGNGSRPGGPNLLAQPQQAVTPPQPHAVVEEQDGLKPVSSIVL